LDDGTTVVRNLGLLVSGMIWCIVPPIALRKAAAIGEPAVDRSASDPAHWKTAAG
jgi:hypothetical protein